MRLATHITVAALVAALLATGPATAEDAMAPDTMAMDAMAPMTGEGDLELCLEQARAITFPSVARAAETACKDMQSGMAPMAGNMMSGDAMAPAN